MEQAPWLQRVTIAVLIGLAPGFKAFSMVSIKLARYLSVKKCSNNLKKYSKSCVLGLSVCFVVENKNFSGLKTLSNP